MIRANKNGKIIEISGIQTSKNGKILNIQRILKNIGGEIKEVIIGQSVAPIELFKKIPLPYAYGSYSIYKMGLGYVRMKSLTITVIAEDCTTVLFQRDVQKLDGMVLFCGYCSKNDSVELFFSKSVGQLNEIYKYTVSSTGIIKERISSLVANQGVLYGVITQLNNRYIVTSPSGIRHMYGYPNTLNNTLLSGLTRSLQNDFIYDGEKYIGISIASSNNIKIWWCYDNNFQVWNSRIITLKGENDLPKIMYINGKYIIYSRYLYTTNDIVNGVLQKIDPRSIGIEAYGTDNIPYISFNYMLLSVGIKSICWFDGMGNVYLTKNGNYFIKIILSTVTWRQYAFVTYADGKYIVDFRQTNEAFEINESAIPDKNVLIEERLNEVYRQI